MGSITATMSAVDTQTVWQGLDVTARQLQIRAKQAGDVDAGIDAYRADALVAWANAALAAPDAPTQQGRRPQIQFVVDLPTLLGLANNPAELVGYGPVAASVVQALAADADWRRLVVEPVTGHLLDYGSLIYRPPQKLKDFLVARDRHCRFPGCNRKATYCDIEHMCAGPGGRYRIATTAVACAEDIIDSRRTAAGRSSCSPMARADGPRPTAARSTSARRPSSTDAASTDQLH